VPMKPTPSGRTSRHRHGTRNAARRRDNPAQVVLQHSTTEQGHGRQENRSYVVVHHVQGIRDRQAWPKLKTVGMCCSERPVKGKTTREVRYFIENGCPQVRQVSANSCSRRGQAEYYQRFATELKPR
jgi:hypothetical protein